MRKYKTILIGCGNAGLLHELDPVRGKPASLIGGLIENNDFFELVGAVDIDIERAKKVLAFFPDVLVYTDYKKAVLDLNPEVVIIATWTNTHKEIFSFCLLNNIKGVIIEKPIGKTLKEAKSMMRLWKKKKIPVVVNHVRRWEPRYLFLKELLETGEFGDLRSVYGKVLLGEIPKKYEKIVHDLEGGGTLLHDGTHLIDLINFYFKRLKIVGKIVKNGKILDKTTNVLLLADNTPVHIEVGGQRGYFEFSLSFEFESRVIRVGNGILEMFQAKESKLYSGYRDLKRIDFPVERLKKYTTNGFSGPFYELRKAFENESTDTSSSLKDGLKAMKIIDEILKDKRG